MDSLTVYFVGICTHLREFTSSREIEHRVVLVNARDSREIHGKTIVGHEAWLHYYDVDGLPQKEPLNGRRITIQNAATTGIVYADSFFTCLSRLTAYAPKMKSLSVAVANGHDPNLVAAYFDITAGRFTAGANHDASVALLDVATNGAPVLVLENFPRHPDGPLVKKIPIHAEKTEVQVENVGPGRDQGDGPQDFLLHYLVATVVPPDASVPTARGDCKVPVSLPFPSNTVDPGCSNSNYP